MTWPLGFLLVALAIVGAVCWRLGYDAGLRAGLKLRLRSRR